MMADLHDKTLAELSAGLGAGDFSSVELTEHYLKRISDFDGQLNSYVTVTGEQALQQAKAADARIASGEAGPLTGIPMAHKDIFCTKRVRTSWAPGCWITSSLRTMRRWCPTWVTPGW